jgi:dTMP kinase
MISHSAFFLSISFSCINNRIRVIQALPRRVSSLLLFMATVTTSSTNEESKGQRGCFIVFEGIDRCGKTTQTQRLQAFLIQDRNRKVELLRFPDRSTESGKVIDRYLKGEQELNDEEVHKLFSRNRWESAERMRGKLLDGIDLVVDRYAFSGVCYTAAKKPREEKSHVAKRKKDEGEKEEEKDEGDKDEEKHTAPPPLSIEWCKIPDKGLPAPDLVILLDMKVEKSKLRGEFGAERYEKEEFQERVKENFLSMIGPTWRVIDASRSIEEVERDVQQAALQAIEVVSKPGKVPIRELW